MRYSLYQAEFERRRRSRNTAVHFERSQRSLVPQWNTCRPKNMQAEPQSAVSNRLRIILRITLQQDERDNVSYLKVNRRAQLVHHLRERCTHRNQFKNAVFSPQIGLLLARASPMGRELSWRPSAVGLVFRHRSHLVRRIQFECVVYSDIIAEAALERLSRIRHSQIVPNE